MSISNRNLPGDQSLKIMQHQIAVLESQLASMQESLNAVHIFTESLVKQLAANGHQAGLVKSPAGNGGIKLTFRP